MSNYLLKNGDGIKNIFIDFGVVLLDLEIARSVKKYADIGIIARLNGQRQSGIFLDIDTGAVDEREFARRLAETSSTPEKATYEKILDAHMSIHGYFPPDKLDFVCALKKSGNYRLFAASNISAEGWKWCKENGFCLKGRKPEDYFDKMFLSFEVGAAKPDDKFFEVAIGESEVNPQESLLIDDSARNCERARFFGMRTYSPVEKENWIPKLFY